MDVKESSNKQSSPVAESAPPQSVFSPPAAAKKATSAAATKAAAHIVWDPFLDMKNRLPNKICLSRINKDMRELNESPLPGVYAWRSEEFVTLIDVIIVGPFDTPYECGFFHFLINCPDDYPYQPPKVKIMTTGGGTCRFNPNLYSNGKVCLSILGTWSGPGWTAVQTISSLCLSIQSLLCANPYRNEPSFESASGHAVEAYNQIISHETIRLAVIEMVSPSSSQNKSLPEKLRKCITELFLSFYETYEINIEANLSVSGRMIDPFGDQLRGKFEYPTLAASLAQVQEHFLQAAEVCEREKVIFELMDMGFSRELAERALEKSSGDYAAAAAMCLEIDSLQDSSHS